jgi:hypothetical protein
MPGDNPPDDLKNLWQELSVNPAPVPIDELRTEVGKLREGLRCRLVIGGAAALVVVVSYILFFFVFPSVFERTGAVMTIVGAGYLIGQILLRRSRKTLDPADTECLRFYRTELERQRDFHRGAWLWSRLALFLPGPLVFCVGFAQAHPRLALVEWFAGVTFLALIAIAVPLNLRLAQKYQRRLDALDRSQKGE